jgi:hypothetical protein
MPGKPTQPFGSIIFSKDGKVRQKTFVLSQHKDAQELEAARRFLDRLANSYPERSLTNLQQLSESDHDFTASFADTRVVIQLAELVDRHFVSQTQRNPSDPVLFRAPGDRAYLDQAAKDKALSQVISAKLAKRYAKPIGGLFWLVVFSTQSYTLQYVCDSATYITEALRITRLHLKNASHVVFDEIWFTDLQTAPICVWPFVEPQPPVNGHA